MKIKNVTKDYQRRCPTCDVVLFENNALTIYDFQCPKCFEVFKCTEDNEYGILE